MSINQRYQVSLLAPVKSSSYFPGFHMYDTGLSIKNCRKWLYHIFSGIWRDEL